MLKKQRSVWNIYLVIIVLFAAQKVYHLITPSSPSFLYYFILRSFDPIFYLVHSAHVLNVFLTVIHCIPLFLYIHRIRFLNPEIWKYLFVLRCIFEIFGHSYQMNTIIAFYQTNAKLTLLISAVMVLPHIPSYVVCYRYAFRQKKIFKSSY